MLQFLLPLLTGVGGKGGALSGLAQGGGFGLGYGFMVRAGYDLYGAVKDQVIGALTGQRYTPNPASSMMGTGGLMGLKHNPQNRDSVDTTTLNTLAGLKKTPKFKEMEALHGPSNAFNFYKAKYGNPLSRTTQTSTVARKFTPRVHTKTGRLETEYQFRKRVYEQTRRQKYYNNKSFYDTFNIKY